MANRDAVRPVDVRGLLANLPPQAKGVLASYDPSLRERTGWAVGGLLSRLGADKHMQRYAADKVGGAIDIVPGAGDVVGVDDAYQDYKSGNLGMAAAGLGLAALGVVPVVGDVAAKAGKKGIRAFHGSPHDFPPVRLIEMSDGTRLYQNMNELAATPEGARVIKEYPLGRFDISKIGTGEGAQAYGHGLYFAESEGVARNYRNNLSGQAQGTPYVADEVRGWLESTGGDYEKASQDARAFLRENGDQMSREQVAELQNAIYLMDRKKESFGSMYEVNINADPEDFLDYDAPFDAQPAAVQKHFAHLAKRGAGPDGSDLARRIESGVFLDEARKAGIPGIKYLDAGSRTVLPDDAIKASLAEYDRQISNAQKQLDALPPSMRGEYQAEIDRLNKERAAVKRKAEPSRNYVVFDDKLIDIVKKYGIAAALSAGLISQQMAEQMQAQGMEL